MIYSKRTNRIEQIRKNKQLSIEEFCAAIGISRKTYYNYKNGCPIPSDKLICMSQLSNCSIDYILGLKDYTQICVTDNKSNLLCLISNSEVIEHDGFHVIFSED